MDNELDKMVTGVLSKLMAEISITGRREQWDMTRIAALIGDEDARRTVAELVLAIMPKWPDGEQWIGWLQGGPPPLPRPLQNPDAGPRPHARGAMLGAQSKHVAAARRVEDLEAKLAEAKQDLAAAARDLDRANEQVRTVVVYRIMTEFGRQASALSLGPLYTVARAVSPHFQRDAAFEASLDVDARDLLEARLETREADSREMLDLLDRFAGEPLLELKLHNVILKVVREFQKAREAQIAEARAARKPVPEAYKRRAIRRSSAQQQREVHPAAIRSDATDVFDAYPSSSPDEDNAGSSSDR